MNKDKNRVSTVLKAALVLVVVIGIIVIIESVGGNRKDTLPNVSPPTMNENRTDASFSTPDEVPPSVDSSLSPPQEPKSIQEENEEYARTFLNEAYERYAQQDYAAAKNAAGISNFYSPSSEADELIETCRAYLIDYYRDRVEIVEDDMDNATFIYPLDRYEESALTSLFCWFSIVNRSNEIYFCITLGFHRDNWLFMERIKLKSDDNEIDLTVSSRNLNTDVMRDASIVEVATLIIEDPFLYYDMVRDQEVRIRFYGRQSNQDYTLSEKQRSDMELMLNYYFQVIL